MGKEWLDGYKVVVKRGSRYKSCVMTNHYKMYDIGLVTKRTSGNGPLAVFGQKRDAIAFKKRERFLGKLYGKFYLFRCRYIESDDNGYWYRLCAYGGHKLCNTHVPGKRFADEVELIEEVEV